MRPGEAKNQIDEEVLPSRALPRLLTDNPCLHLNVTPFVALEDLRKTLADRVVVSRTPTSLACPVAVLKSMVGDREPAEIRLAGGPATIPYDLTKARGRYGFHTDKTRHRPSLRRAGGGSTAGSESSTKAEKAVREVRRGEGVVWKQRWETHRRCRFQVRVRAEFGG